VVHAAQGHGDTYTEVLTLFVRLYSEPLLVGGSAAAAAPLQPVAANDAASAWALATASASPTRGGASASDGTNRARQALPQAMQLLAEHCPASLPLLGDMLRPLLILLSEVAVLAQRELATDGTAAVRSVAAHLGSLLPCIACLCRKAAAAAAAGEAGGETSSAASPEAAALACLGGAPALSTKLLRNLWFYCTIYELVPPTTTTAHAKNSKHAHAPYRWPMEWATALTDIAAVTPPLLLTSAHQVEERVVELTAMLQGVSNTLVARVRSQLVSAVQRDAALAAQLEAEPPGKALLLAATLHLELARARAAGGTMRVPVSYLQPRTALDAASHTVQVRSR